MMKFTFSVAVEDEVGKLLLPTIAALLAGQSAPALLPPAIPATPSARPATRARRASRTSPSSPADDPALRVEDVHDVGEHLDDIAVDREDLVGREDERVDDVDVAREHEGVDASVAAEQVTCTVATSTNKGSSLSPGDLALIAAGLLPAPNTAAEDGTASLLSDVAFEFGRVVDLLGRPAAVSITRTQLPEGVVFTGTIETLPLHVLPTLLETLRAAG
jgi:hypothetical protein